MPDLSVELFGIRFKNPVWVASGTFGYGLEALELYDVSKLGAVVTKGISLRPRQGNAPERIAETPCGMLNSIGLQNPGVEGFLKKIYPEIKKIDTHFIANVFGEEEEEYVEVCLALEEAEKVVAYELNVSCPNVKKGGMLFGHDPEVLRRLIERVKSKVKKPVLVKLSPNTGDVKSFAKVCVEAGADGLVLINTLLGMKIDVNSQRPELSTLMGGLSGPAILPIAVRMVWEVFSYLGHSNPIVGVGYGEVGKYLQPYFEKGLIDNTSHCHNTYITVLAENGLLGLTFLLAFFTYFTWKYWQYYKTYNDIILKVLSISLYGVFINLMIASLTEHIIKNFVLWGFVSFLMGITEAYRRSITLPQADGPFPQGR